ncbi:MAG: cobyrinate a,c-diamide synthase [Desulfonatronovibrionaceae bacterium]
MNFPRLVLAGLKGGSGKTIISLSLCRAWHDQKLKVKPFKKGPDYIDAKWLSLAAGHKASNLDPFLFPSSRVLDLFWSFACSSDVAVVEGNRGLFDGKDVQGTFSTAELARLLKAPVVLVLDCTKSTRTMAALVHGCKTFEPDLTLAGVILNQTAGKRHKDIVRRSIETHTQVPVLGELPKIRENLIPERHMGLISDQEFRATQEIFAFLSSVGRDCLDLERIMQVARSAPPGEGPAPSTGFSIVRQSGPVIGVVRDAALWFYYQENIDALRRAGASVVELSLLEKKPWPEIHGLYLGGGFPETLGTGLSENHGLKTAMAALVRHGLPVYAECGGFMYLGRYLTYAGQTFPMAGILPVETSVSKKPQGHGYVEGTIVRENPFFPVDSWVCGHEFHYSSCRLASDLPFEFALKLERGVGINGSMDGLIHKNVLAGYTHIHALGHECWAPNFVRAAGKFKECRENARSCPDVIAVDK